MDFEKNEIENQTESTATRRRFLIALGIGGATIAVATTTAIASSLSDDDDDSDHDNSGPGSDNEGDRDSDHSGPGSGDDKDDDSDHSGHGDDDDDDQVTIDGEIPPGSTEIRIIDDDPNGFSPQTVTIEAGQSVTFVNAHDDPHTATGGSFDTGILQPGLIATIIFDEPGTFPFACQIHPEMTGTIEVTGGTGTPDSATPAASPATTSNGEVAVTIENLEFQPKELRIANGSSVTWTNQDAMAHTATSLDGTFDTGNLAQGQSGTITFDSPGQFDYQCAIHTGMKGSIIVE